MESKINIKKIGNREEVFSGIANKTSGGMNKDDIILNPKKKAKKKFLSKKISTRMKNDSPLIKYKKYKKLSKKQNNENLTEEQILKNIKRERKLERLKRKIKKSKMNKKEISFDNLKKKNKNNMKKTKKVSFSLENNKTKEFHTFLDNENHYNGYDEDDEDEDDDNFNFLKNYKQENNQTKNEFKIENMPEISDEELFQ